MRTVAFLVVVCSAIGMSGCSSTQSYVSADLESVEGVERPEFKEVDIKQAFEVKANLPKPFRMGVYFKKPDNNLQGNWRWKAKEKSRVLDGLRKALPKDAVSAIFQVDEGLANEQTIPEIRLASAKYQADAVLVVEAKAFVATDMNRWAWSYALIVPIFFIQGNDLESVFAMKANLWDVRNEKLYFSTSSEGEVEESYSPAWKQGDKKYLQKSKELALANFEEEIKNVFER